LKKKNISPVLRVPGLVLSRRFLAPLGVLLVMKTLDNEWYVVIKPYKLTVFEILRSFLYCHILHVRAIPILEFTDSMIYHALLLFYFSAYTHAGWGAGGRGVYCCFVFESHTYTHAGSGLQGGYPMMKQLVSN